MIDTLSYQIMEFLSKVGVKHIFFVPGGGNMFLVDAARRHPEIKCIFTHDESLREKTLWLLRWPCLFMLHKDVSVERIYCWEFTNSLKA